MKVSKEDLKKYIYKCGGCGHKFKSKSDLSLHSCSNDKEFDEMMDSGHKALEALRNLNKALRENQ